MDRRNSHKTKKVAVPPSGVSWVKVPFNLSVDPKSFTTLSPPVRKPVFFGDIIKNHR